MHSVWNPFSGTSSILGRLCRLWNMGRCLGKKNLYFRCKSMPTCRRLRFLCLAENIPQIGRHFVPASSMRKQNESHSVERGKVCIILLPCFVRKRFSVSKFFQYFHFHENVITKGLSLVFYACMPDVMKSHITYITLICVTS